MPSLYLKKIIMSDHFIPQKDSAWINHEYYWHEIIEVTFSDDQCRLLEAIVTTHNNDTKLTRDWCYSRQLLIDRINSGDRFMIGNKRLQIVTVNGQPYIRTDQEQIEADDVQ